MKYVSFIGADGRPSAEKLAAVKSELPSWITEMDDRGVRLLGRPLDHPATASTVRVRDGETLVTDGPFTEAKEFIAGFDLLDCADLDEAIQVMAKGPIARFQSIEIRPLTGELLLDEKAAAFGRGGDGDATPYLLATWTSGASAATASEVEAWRKDVAARGRHVLGATLAAGETATTVRVRDGKTLLSDGPFIEAPEFVSDIEVVSCADRQQAIDLAAAHPGARSAVIEVRPFS